MKRLFFLFLCLMCMNAAPAYPYWIWTPKTGKWVNPKAEARATPKEQLTFALGLLEAKNYQEAEREFQKLLKKFPRSAEAAESQYYLGIIQEAQGDYYAAFQAYQKVIDKYPFSERIQEIIEREFKIAERFTAGEKRKALGVALPVENPALEIYAKVVENSTYGPLAPKAQYKLGLLLKGLMRYQEAEDAFNKVISNYPNSEWVEAAKFQLAASRAALSRGSEYDQGATREAKEQFESFVRDHPDAVLSREAQQQVDELSEKEAQGMLDIGRFYEKQKAWGAARIYYRRIIDKYPQSEYAPQALERLQVLEKRTK